MVEVAFVVHHITRIVGHPQFFHPGFWDTKPELETPRSRNLRRLLCKFLTSGHYC
jgi:hypothetical protein